ncbi:Irregular chiasm C-roughest protein [Papilio machaon]|uniref:Irregular chiasm C-roughest protein n=1 Tax=Papilio machaon TaxID=76193 RepID=A0A194RJT7_PAPMA|nr:Irregular chiasm C-roughest protein [Papilio machaon]
MSNSILTRQFGDEFQYVTSNLSGNLTSGIVYKHKARCEISLSFYDAPEIRRDVGFSHFTTITSNDNNFGFTMALRSEPPIRSRYARLTVLVPPEPPRILQSPILQAVEDQEIDLECISVGGKPAAEITWVDAEGGVLTQGVTYTVEQMADSRRFTARSVLHLRPRRSHHNQSFTCQAQNTADRAYRAASIKLQVQYAPRVRIFIKTSLKNNRIQEGDTLILGCQATANPNNLTYKWFVNNDQIIGNINNEIVIPNVSRKYNEATVKCEVHNTVGKSADSKTLEVAYGPKFKVKPQNVEGDSGSIATMNCVVDGHPLPKITWLRYENERIIRVGKSTNLTVTVTRQSAGQYWCRASVEGYPDIEASAMVFVKGPPKIISNRTQYGVEGDSVRVECISLSVPKPDFVIWSFEGNEINSFHNHEYAFLEETLTDRTSKSTLIIRESQSKHFGTYNCSVSNSYGTDTVEINLIPDKSFNLLIIISGAAGSVILLLIVMLIIMLCHRKSNKTDVKKPDITDIGKTCIDQFKDSDRNSNISDLKMELRQVEGSCDMAQGQSNGYVPYVDYARDYAPPLTSDSLSGSLSRSTDESTYLSHCGSLRRQSSSGRLSGLVGPDLIPMGNPGVVIGGGLDVRYAATYGNPYLRASGPIAYAAHANTAPAKSAPPPYYTLRSNNHPPNVPNVISPSSSSSSRPVTSPLASSSSTSSAQPQVPKASPQSTGALYILPPSSQGNLQSCQITKGNGSHLAAGTHYKVRDLRDLQARDWHRTTQDRDLGDLLYGGQDLLWASGVTS